MPFDVGTWYTQVGNIFKSIEHMSVFIFSLRLLQSNTWIVDGHYPPLKRWSDRNAFHQIETCRYLHFFSFWNSWKAIVVAETLLIGKTPPVVASRALSMKRNWNRADIWLWETSGNKNDDSIDSELTEWRKRNRNSSLCLSVDACVRGGRGESLIFGFCLTNDDQCRTIPSSF